MAVSFSRTCWRNMLEAHAPVDWLMDFNRQPLMIGFIVVGSVAVLQLVSLLLVSEDLHAAACLGGSAAISVLGALMMAKRFRMRASIKMGIAICAFLGLVSVGGVVMTLAGDTISRARTHAASITIWKSLPALFGFPILPAAMFILWTLVVDVGSWWCVHHFLGDPNDLRQHMSAVIFAFGWLAAAQMNSGRLRSIFDAQEALAAEKVLMDSIITMMCDGTVWLSENGSTVVRTDQRIKMMVGRDVTGEHVASLLVTEERESLRLHLSEAKKAPTLLPTTLLTEGGAKVPVEMFIVGNREIRSVEGKAGMTPGFLIGLRTASREGMETFQDADLNEEQQDLLLRTSDAREDELHSAAAPSSLPETTATGKVFDHVDIDRWLERSPDEQTDEVRSRLEKVVSLGQQEHWLMSSKELSIAADRILGAGSFGVVVCGWLHGSPVAVKTAKRSADSASVQHLAKIANEVRILRHLRHQNIVLFHGACIEAEKGEILLVLERVQGSDLSEYVVRHSADADAGSRVRLLLDVARALRYLHAQRPQVVHGDLKGSNVLVEEAMPRAKLVDFGLSKLLTKGVRPLGGTLTWMAPEVICRKSRPTASADVFSFGRVAYLAVDCRKPLEGVRPRVVVDMARSGVVHALTWDDGRPLHEECKRLCERMLSPNPDQRPSMPEVHQEVSAWRLPGGNARAEAMEEEPTHGPRDTGDFREVLSSALSRHSQAVQAPAPNGAGDAAGRATSSNSSGPQAAAAVAAGGAPAAQGDLARPALRPTDEKVQKLMMAEMALQWNYRIPAGCCCSYHAAVAELERVRLGLARGQCNERFRPFRHQCQSCGVLECRAGGRCPYCSQGGERTLGSIQEEGEAEEGARCSL